eukprot:1201121-Amphidinium_carterae.2
MDFGWPDRSFSGKSALLRGSLPRRSGLLGEGQCLALARAFAYKQSRSLNEPHAQAWKQLLHDVADFIGSLPLTLGSTWRCITLLCASRWIWSKLGVSVSGLWTGSIPNSPFASHIHSESPQDSQFICSEVFSKCSLKF